MRTLLAILCVAALAATSACASDINFGATARSTAMGGAGIALGDDSGTTTMLNPAAPACSGAKFRFIFPGLDFHTTGATFGDLADSMSKVSGGGTSDALDLVNTFAKRPTTLQLNALTGFAGTFGLTLEAQASGVITPSAEAQKWASASQQLSDTSGLDLNTLQTTLNNTNFNSAVANALAGNIPAATTAFDAYLTELNQNYVSANVVYGPGVLLSRGLDTSKGRMWLGTNVKVLSSQGKTWQIRASRTNNSPLSVVGGTNVQANLDFEAVELPGSNGTTTSLKADVGMIYKPNNSILQYGAVVNNFIKPNIKGITSTQDEMMISGGIAAVAGRNLTLAADLVNITGANGEKASLRMGGEFRLGRMFAARAGYSGSQWTTGLEILGLNLSWAGSSAQMLSNVLKF